MGLISKSLAIGLVVVCVIGSGIAGFFLGTTQSGSKATSNGTPTGITDVEIYVIQGGTIYLVQNATYSELNSWMNCSFLFVCVSGDSVTFTLSAYNNAIGPNNTPTTITISKIDQLSVTSSAASLLSVNPQPPIAFRGVSDSIVFQLDIEVTGSGPLAVYVTAS